MTAQLPCSADSRPGDFFMAFMDHAVIGHVVEETNKHQAILENIFEKKASAKMQGWSLLTIPEFYVFLALTMLMVHV